VASNFNCVVTVCEYFSLTTQEESKLATLQWRFCSNNRFQPPES